MMSKFNIRLYPKFSFTLTTENMNVYASFFSGKEKEAIAFISKYGWTHFITNIQHIIKRDLPGFENLAGLENKSKQ